MLEDHVVVIFDELPGGTPVLGQLDLLALVAIEDVRTFRRAPYLRGNAHPIVEVDGDEALIERLVVKRVEQ